MINYQKPLQERSKFKSPSKRIMDQVQEVAIPKREGHATRNKCVRWRGVFTDEDLLRIRRKVSLNYVKIST